MTTKQALESLADAAPFIALFVGFIIFTTLISLPFIGMLALGTNH